MPKSAFQDMHRCLHFANNWEEIESDDGHRELYDDLDIADTVLE